MHTLSQQTLMEGKNLSITCEASPGNPWFTTFFWTKVNDQGFKQNGPTLELPSIQRASSGTYRCTAENNYNNGEKGSDSQTMEVNVLCMCLIRVRNHTNNSCMFYHKYHRLNVLGRCGYQLSLITHTR